MLSMLHSFGALGATIQKELAPVPGRLTTLWRYLVASAIVIVVSMALQVPFLALSLIAIFSTTLQNTFLQRLSGLLATVGLTLAVACTLLLLRLTFDVPLLRILGSAFILLGAMYFLRASKLGAIGFLVGLAVIYVQSEVDTVHNPELLTRAVLWVWVAITYPIAVNILVGHLLPACAVGGDVPGFCPTGAGRGATKRRHGPRCRSKGFRFQLEYDRPPVRAQSRTGHLSRLSVLHRRPVARDSYLHAHLYYSGLAWFGGH